MSYQLGVEFGSKLVHLPDEDKTIKVQSAYPAFSHLGILLTLCSVWDTAGSEQFRSITRSYYRGAAGALLVYDATSRASTPIVSPRRIVSDDLAGFNNAKSWLLDVREHADPNLTCILVGNKVDLAEGDEGRRAVSTEEAREWAEQERLLFIEASAKTGENIDQVRCCSDPLYLLSDVWCRHSSKRYEIYWRRSRAAYSTITKYARSFCYHPCVFSRGTQSSGIKSSRPSTGASNTLSLEGDPKPRSSTCCT